MIARKCILAVTIVMSVDFGQIISSSVDTDWSTPFEETLSTLTSAYNEFKSQDKVSDFAKTSYTEWIAYSKVAVANFIETAGHILQESDKSIEEQIEEDRTRVDNTLILPENLSPATVFEFYAETLKSFSDSNPAKAPFLSPKLLSENAELQKEFQDKFKELYKTYSDNFLEYARSFTNKLVESNVYRKWVMQPV